MDGNNLERVKEVAASRLGGDWSSPSKHFLVTNRKHESTPAQGRTNAVSFHLDTRLILLIMACERSSPCSGFHRPHGEGLRFTMDCTG
jgi:hypothetical protein